MLHKYIIQGISILFLVCLFACSSEDKIQFDEIRKPYETITPIISELLKSDDNLTDDKVAAFWSKADSNGLPVVEIDPLNDEYNYITIAYRNSNKNLKVKFNVFGIYDDYHLGDGEMYRFRDSDLYYRCYTMPKDICFAYNFLITDTVTGEFYKHSDSYNPKRIPTGEFKNYSYSAFDLIGDDLEWNYQPKVETGSRIDTLEYVDKILNKSHNIYVYLPPEYDDNKEYPVIYLFDAFIYMNRVEVPHILDNLIKTKKIKPMIAVMFGNYRESRKILLPLNPDFKDEFVNDFLPFIRNNYSVSEKPEDNIIGGMSYGGLAAAYIAFHHSDIFGKVLSQSGSFWRDIVLTDSHDNEIRNDWLIDQFSTSEKKI